MPRKGIQGLDAAADILIFAGRQAGLGVRDLIDLLEAGMSIGQLAEYLVAKLTEKPLES